MSIEAYPSPNGVLTSLIWRKTAAGGETSLSGYDNASQALSYTPGQEQVYLNGILLVRGSDYTATNGTSITGLTALAADDFVQINCYNNFSVASVPATSLTGTVANNQLANSSITINGSAVSLGGSVSLPGDIESVTASSPLTGGGSSGALTIGIQSASTSQAGSVQLSDSTSTTSSVLAATPTAVKSAYDLANGAIPKTLTTTTGDIIYASGANTPARLGIGSTGNVLTVASGVPSWSAPAGGGGLTLLSTTTLSGTTVDISSISQDYTNLRIFVKGMYGTVDNLQPKIRFNNDSNSRYVWGIMGVRIGSGTVDSGASGSSTTSVYFTNGSAGTDFNRLNFVSLYLPRYTDTSNQFFTMQTYGSADATNTNWGPYWVSGVYNAQAAITSINLIRDNGNFGGGTVYIYGEK